MTGYPRLLRRGGRYYFRAKVPEDIRGVIGKAEVKFSLGTSDRATAIEKVKIETIKCDKEFKAARAKLNAQPLILDDLSESEIRRLADIVHHRTLERDEIRRLRGDFLDDPRWERRKDSTSLFIPGMREAFARGDYSGAQYDIEFLLEGEGIALNPDCDAHIRLSRAVLAAMIEAQDALSQRMAGDDIPTPPAPPSREDAAPGGLSGFSKFGEVAEAWKVARSRKAAQWNNDRTAINRFKKIVGDLRIRDIDQSRIEHFRNELAKLRGRHPGTKLNPQTTLRTLTTIRSIFKWAKDEKHLIEVDPSKEVTVKVANEDLRNRRLPYDGVDLHRIFSSPIFTEGLRPERGGGEAAFWIPLFGPLEGARLEEIGQLRVYDIRDVFGVMVMDINDNPDQIPAKPGVRNKSVKNPGSRRLVPLHPCLGELGFREYWETVRAANPNGLLFPDLLLDRDGKTTKIFSDWYGEYSDQFVPDPQKAFHSYRHSFKDACRNARIPEDVHDALTGHSDGSVSRGYGLGHPYDVLAQEIAKVEYPTIDFASIRPYRRP